MAAITERFSTAVADRYRLDRRLGEGGMATVYLAEDLKHDRKVAIKVLKPELAAVLGAERFVQEIKTTASLQHPHILPLFDSGEADGFLFYVMPYIEGETIREKLDRETQFGIEEAVRITAEVAGALDYAHRNGVIHRDIKPENILLHDGRPMVMDFGIALAVSAAAGGRMTETGLSLGTPHYMSPEQATAEREITARSDVYSLAVVLYEMLAGAPPHLGGSAQQIIMKIVTDTPRPVSELRKSVPPNVTVAVAKALEKLPADRFESAARFVEALENSAFTQQATTASVEAKEAGARSRAPLIFGAAIAMGGLGWVLGRVQSSTIESIATTRFTVGIPGRVDLDWNIPIALSPTGRAFLYRANGMLYQRSLDAFDAEPLDGTEGASKPTYSPDGEWIAFSQGSRLRKMSSHGGPITEVAPIRVDNSTLGIDWGDDNHIVFTRGLGHAGVWRVPATGGDAERLTTVRDSLLETVHAWPQLLPGSRHLLFTVVGPSGGWDDASIVIKDLRTGERHVVVEQGATYGRYVDPGYLFYIDAAGTVLAAQFDLAELTFSGASVPVESNVRTGWWGGWASFGVSGGGTAAFIRGTPFEDHLVWLVDRDGNRVRQLGTASSVDGMALSPDGGLLAMTVRTANNDDIYLLDMATNEAQRFSFDPAEDETPVWSPDGRQVAYSSAWTGQARRIYVKDVVTGAEPVLVYTGDKHIHLTSWSPDGKWLAFDQFDLENQTDVYALRVDSTDHVVSIADSRAAEAAARFSPNGRWVAYTATDQAGSQVYVVSFPGAEVKHQVSPSGGMVPHWSAAGELFYWAGTTLMTSQVSTEEVFRWSPPKTIVDVPDCCAPGNEYEVTPDGQHIILRVTNPDAGLTEVQVVVNWLQEVRTKLESQRASR